MSKVVRGGEDHGRQLMNLHNNEAGRRVRKTFSNYLVLNIWKKFHFEIVVMEIGKVLVGKHDRGILRSLCSLHKTISYTDDH